MLFNDVFSAGRVGVLTLGSRKYVGCHCDPGSLICTRGTDKSLARPGRKQATATENLEFHVSCLQS